MQTCVPLSPSRGYHHIMQVFDFLASPHKCRFAPKLSLLKDARSCLVYRKHIFPPFITVNENKMPETSSPHTTVGDTEGFVENPIRRSTLPDEMHIL